MQKNTFYMDMDALVDEANPVLPSENKNDIEKRFEEFEVVDNNDGKKVYNHTPFKKSLSERNINIKEFEKTVHEVCKKYDDVRYEDFPDEVVEEYFAFENRLINILGGVGVKKHDKDVIEWLNILTKNRKNDFSEEDFSGTIDFLVKLGEQYNLLIVDWKSRRIVDMKNKQEVKAWLKAKTFITRIANEQL